MILIKFLRKKNNEGNIKIIASLKKFKINKEKIQTFFKIIYQKLKKLWLQFINFRIKISSKLKLKMED